MIIPAHLFIIREIHDGDIEEEIREAFRVFDKEGHGFIPVPDLTEVPSLLDFRLNIDFKAVLGERTVRSHSDIPQALFEYHAIPQVLQKLGEKLSSDECQVLNAVKFQKSLFLEKVAPGGPICSPLFLLLSIYSFVFKGAIKKMLPGTDERS